MIPDTISAIIIFPKAAHKLNVHNNLAKKLPDQEVISRSSDVEFLTWPADLPVDTQLLEFAQFSATQNNALSCVHENHLFTFSLPVRNSENNIVCHLSIKLSSENQTKESAVRVIEWAAIWLGQLLEQKQNNNLLSAQKIGSEVLDDSDSISQQTHEELAEKKLFSDVFCQPYSKWLLAAVIIIALLFVPINYRISASATLKGKIESSVIAPFNGFIKEVLVKPGDKVDVAQVLASLDVTNITLKLDKLQGDHQEKQKMYRRALVEGERGSAEIYKTQLSQIQPNIDLAQQDINNSKLKSLIKGTIIEGDLRDFIGKPINKGDLLFKIAPSDQFRVVLDIKESDIRFIDRGQLASLKLGSLPNSEQIITLHKPSPIFIEENNQLIYKVEASLDIEKNALFAPGMAGIAKINVGSASIGWYLFHHFSDWIQMNWWSFKP